MNGIPESQKLESARNVNLPIGTEKRSKNMIGKRFGKLVVLKENPIRTLSRSKRYDCACDCGGNVTVRGASLRGGTKSCGCIRVEMFIKMATGHGLTGHELHHKWNAMRYRCYNKNTKRYKNYGGRGINVCREWLDSFSAFYNWGIKNGWKPGLTIDRINNNGDYSPDNCHFVDKEKNNRNMSTSCWWVVNKIKFESCGEAAKYFKVSNSTILRWCGGYVSSSGYWVPPRPFSHKVNKYENNSMRTR